MKSNESKLIFTLHMGCVDVRLNLLSDEIKGLDIIYTSAKNNELDKVIRASRTFFGANMVPANEKGMIQLYKNFLNKNFESRPRIVLSIFPRIPAFFLIVSSDFL